MVSLSAADKSTVNKDSNGLLDDKLGVILNKINGDEPVEPALKETFDKVERAKQEWESTVDALPELIFIINGNGRIIRVNRTIERWQLGSVKEVIGSSYHSLVHPDCQHFCYLLESVRQSKIEGSVIELETLDERLRRYISIRVQPVAIGNFDAHRHSNFVVILRDISTRKKAEEALHRRNSRLITLNAINKAILAAASPVEIARATLKRIHAFIPYQRAHLLIKSPETDQLDVLAAIHHEHKLSFKAGDQIPKTMFKHAEEKKYNKFYIEKNLNNLDNPTPFESDLLTQNINAYMNVPLKTGDYNIGTLQLTANNTAVFQPEPIEVIREVAETLTIAIQQSQLNQKLSRTNDELQRILRTKHEVMQDVSHDLRSPLALIKGYAELMKDGFMGPLNEKQSNALNIIDKKGQQLLILVNRLFKLQTIGKDTLEKVPVNLATQLNDVAQSWQILTTNKNIHLRSRIQSDLPTIMADPNLLDQVFTNLLDNALKFSPEGSKISISAEKKGNEIVVAIIDQGQGIEPEKAKKIFDRFYQVKSSGQAKAGAGIGLALCKAIVDAHDGRIWASSQGKRQGTTFYIALPVDKIEEPEA